MANEAAAASIDPFDSAFADLVKDTGDGANTPVPQPAAPETPAAAAPETPETPAVEEPASEIEGAPAEGEEGGEGGEGGEGQDPPAEGAAAPKQGDRTTDGDAINRLVEALEKRQPVPQPQQRQDPTPPPPTSPFSAEDQAFLVQYATDFPDVMRAEALHRRVEYNQLTAHIFREVANYFAPRLALLDQLADSAAYGAVLQRVPNYDATRDKVIEWVKTQPTYLQGAYNHVIANGTAEEIGDLFDRYSQATGTSAKPNVSGEGIAPQAGTVANRQPPAAARQSAELSPAAKNAAARLAPVNGKRSAPTQVAPQTFDAAFEAFAKEAEAAAS